MTDLQVFTENYYEVLEIPPETDDLGITEAYWRLANRYRDGLSPEPPTEEALERLDRAYATLGSKIRRLAYDRQHGLSGSEALLPSALLNDDVAVGARLSEQSAAAATLERGDEPVAATDLSAFEESYYDLLGVPPETDHDGITKAYWRLANYYGDHLTVDPAAGDELGKLNAAYSVLDQPAWRLEYDRLHGFPGPRPIPLSMSSRRKAAVGERRPEDGLSAATQGTGERRVLARLNDLIRLASPFVGRGRERIARSLPASWGLIWRFLWDPLRWALLLSEVWAIIVLVWHFRGDFSRETEFSSALVFTALAGIGAAVFALAEVVKQLEATRAELRNSLDVSTHGDMAPSDNPLLLAAVRRGEQARTSGERF